MASPCRTSFASGASHPHLGPDSERQLERKGVTCCETFDGVLPVFRNRPVVGGGEEIVGVATEAPFETAWTNQVAGIYSLRAQATDDLGATTTSAPVQVRASTLRADPVRPGFRADGAFQVQSVGQPGRGFLIEASQGPQHWNTLTIGLLTEETFEFVDTEAPAQPQRFHRVKPSPGAGRCRGWTPRPPSRLIPPAGRGRSGPRAGAPPDR
jgi:hypothetical protein